MNRVFGAYISNLPIGVAGLPMFFPPQSIRELSYPPLVEQVGKARGANGCSLTTSCTDCQAWILPVLR